MLAYMEVCTCVFSLSIKHSSLQHGKCTISLRSTGSQITSRKISRCVVILGYAEVYWGMQECVVRGVDEVYLGMHKCRNYKVGSLWIRLVELH